MRATVAALCLFLFAGVAVSPAQNTQQGATLPQPDYSFVNCSGFITDQKVPDEIKLISGEQSNYKVTFARGDYVYINRGQDKGVRVGDRYSVVRSEPDPLEVSWFKWQSKLMKAMGTHYIDAGQLRIVNVQPKTETAQVTFSCDYMQRGDIEVTYEERPEPANKDAGDFVVSNEELPEPVYKDAGAFDIFAPVSVKPVAMLVSSKDYSQSASRGAAVYVNLGTNKGVKVGD